MYVSIESILILQEKKINLDQCIMDYMEMPEDKVYKTPNLKNGFAPVARKRNLAPVKLTPFRQQESTTPLPCKRRSITSQILEESKINRECLFAEEDEKIDDDFDTTEYSCEEVPPFIEVYFLIVIILKIARNN